jgi:ferredoxin
VSDIEEREVAGLRVRIDRTLCVGFEDCMEDGPALFRLDDEGICTFGDDPDAVDRQTVLRACEICPVDALEVYDADGAKLV